MIKIPLLLLFLFPPLHISFHFCILFSRPLITIDMHHHHVGEMISLFNQLINRERCMCAENYMRLGLVQSFECKLMLTMNYDWFNYPCQLDDVNESYRLKSNTQKLIDMQVWFLSSFSFSHAIKHNYLDCDFPKIFFFYHRIFFLSVHITLVIHHQFHSSRSNRNCCGFNN